MKALFARDIVTQRWVIALAAVYSVIFFGMFGLIGEEAGSMVYVLSALASGLMVTFGSFKADRNNTLLLMLSLPSTKHDVVHEKYLLIVATAVFGLVCAIVMGLLMRLIGARVLAVSGMDVVRVAAGTGLLAGMIPVYLRFGHKAVRAIMVGLLTVGVALQVALALVVAISPGSFTDVIDAVLAWYRSMPVARRNLWWSVAGATVFAGTYVLSLWFYPRRDQ
jgi:hypothetical protein